MRRILLFGLCLVGCGCTWLERRTRDFGDCFRVAGGVGLGLAADAQVTDYISPGIGFASKTWNLGWYDREIYGHWVESDVINTPRIAYEVVADELDHQAKDQFDEGMVVTQLALSSLNLPNERWIQHGNTVSVEYFALFNFWNLGKAQRARFLGGSLIDADGPIVTPRKAFWQRAFVEVGATVAVVHGRLGWNPAETVDFIAGLFGFDPADDDDEGEFYRLRALSLPIAAPLR